eukprot:PhM_4_TR12808/c0_g1_i1/m.32498
MMTSSTLFQQKAKATLPRIMNTATLFKRVTAPASTAPALRWCLLDVRAPYEVERTGLIIGALSVPLHELHTALALSPKRFEEEYGFLLPQKHHEVIFYCDHGPRSLAAYEIARHHGYQQLWVYEGGMREWLRAHPDVVLKLDIPADDEMPPLTNSDPTMPQFERARPK